MHYYIIFVFHNYEWMTVYLIIWTYREGNTWKRNAYNDIYSGNSLSVPIYLTTALITDGSQWRQIGITFIKRLDPKIVLPHICQILRLMNKTPPQSIMPTGSEHVVGLRYVPFNSLELCSERRIEYSAFTTHSSALPIRL